jgi:hypothetical protein
MIGMPGAANESPALAARLQPYLRPGEDLLWCGRPDPAVFVSSADVIAIPFSLVWLGIAVAIERGAAGSGTQFRLVADLGMPTMGRSSSRRVAPGQITFMDVADPDAMLAAINRAKSVLPAGEA